MPQELPTDFKSFALSHRDEIYSCICKYLPQGEPAEHNKMVRCYVDRKGKYRRPSYILLWNLLYGKNLDNAILPAATMQASEDWILMHDDWMDSNTLRRGQPTAHVLFGERYAINAADNLHMIDWKIAKDAADLLGAQRGKRFFDKFYDMMQVTHQGQYLDMHLTYDIKDITKFTVDDYFKSIHAKTAYYSVYGPMQIGAIVANASEEIVEHIPEYGIPAGNAFQIKDDILDCVSTEGVLGKAIGTDVRGGVKTIILWHSVQHASESTLSRLKEIYAKDPAQKSKEDISFVLDTFNELGSIAYAEAEAKRLVDEAITKFNELSKDIPESPLKELARNSIGSTAKRDR